MAVSQLRLRPTAQPLPSTFAKGRSKCGGQRDTAAYAVYCPNRSPLHVDVALHVIAWCSLTHRESSLINLCWCKYSARVRVASGIGRSVSSMLSMLSESVIRTVSFRRIFLFANICVSICTRGVSSVMSLHLFANCCNAKHCCVWHLVSYEHLYFWILLW